MHISDGVLSTPVVVGSYVVTGILSAISLCKMKQDEIPKVAITTSVFFVASLIHIPIGPASVHLILNGLVGILLGSTAFVSILVGLILHAFLFQHGGITTLGVNTLIMGIPAILSFWLFCLGKRIKVFIAGFIAGVSGILFGAFILATFLATTGGKFIEIAKIVILAHLPVVFIEGLITGFVATFLMKVKPEMLEGKDASTRDR